MTVIAGAGHAQMGTPRTVAFLGLHLQNDNQSLDPTSKAETERIHKIEQIFTRKLDALGHYKVLTPSPAMAEKITTGPEPGACNGCEISYAKEMGAEDAAWITVQKVSNLILNMNVYIGDTASGKMTFVHSVDIRGNTDESWTRSLNYLLDNYLLAAPATQ